MRRLCCLCCWQHEEPAGPDKLLKNIVMERQPCVLPGLSSSNTSLDAPSTVIPADAVRPTWQLTRPHSLCLQAGQMQVNTAAPCSPCKLRTFLPTKYICQEWVFITPYSASSKQHIRRATLFRTKSVFDSCVPSAHRAGVGGLILRYLLPSPCAGP